MSGAGLKIPLISIHQMRALSSCIVPYRTLRCRFRSAQRLDLSVNWPTTCPSEPGERDLWRGVATPLGAGSGAAGVCVWELVYPRSVRAPVERGALRKPGDWRYLPPLKSRGAEEAGDYPRVHVRREGCASCRGRVSITHSCRRRDSSHALRSRIRSTRRHHPRVRRRAQARRTPRRVTAAPVVWSRPRSRRCTRLRGADEEARAATVTARTTVAPMMTPTMAPRWQYTQRPHFSSAQCRFAAHTSPSLPPASRRSRARGRQQCSRPRRGLRGAQLHWLAFRRFPHVVLHPVRAAGGRACNPLNPPVATSPLGVSTRSTFPIR